VFYTLYEALNGRVVVGSGQVDVDEPNVVGWVEERNVYGFRVGRRWVSWAEGGTPRPRTGEYAEVELDSEGYAVRVEVRAWRPTIPCLN
jgi:hypothetical protein